MALAPSLDLVFVPSSSSNLLSIATWSVASMPINSSAIILFTLSTAFKTPLPRYLDLSPSRNSSASFSPVEAPEGTAARPNAPLSSNTSTSIVGFPLESKISLAVMSFINIVIFLLFDLTFERNAVINFVTPKIKNVLLITRCNLTGLQIFHIVLTLTFMICRSFRLIFNFIAGFYTFHLFHI